MIIKTAINFFLLLKNFSHKAGYDFKQAIDYRQANCT